MTGASFREVAVQALSSCSVHTGGLDRCVGDEQPPETAWHCPRWNTLFCQRTNAVMYSLPSLLALRQPPDAGECAIVHFAEKKEVKKCLLLAA